MHVLTTEAKHTKITDTRMKNSFDQLNFIIHTFRQNFYFEDISILNEKVVKILKNLYAKNRHFRVEKDRFF